MPKIACGWIAGREAQKAFKHVDADHNGKISRDEWIEKFGNDKHFDAYDLDGDGCISPEEWLEGQIGMAAFNSVDKVRLLHYPHHHHHCQSLLSLLLLTDWTTRNSLPSL